MESSSKPLILVTGITGYIGSSVAKAILDNANDAYRLRASVRSLTNQAKLDPLRKAFGEEKFNQIEFVEADLTQDESLFKAIEGCQFIVHVASPIPGEKSLKDEEMIKPAQEGMKTIINAATQNKVQRIVVTSSFSSILGGVWKKVMGSNNYSEKDFAPMEGADGYAKSKIAQEQVCRDFLVQQDKTTQAGDYKLEIVTIHPTMVIGPTLIKEQNSSVAAFAKFMTGGIPGVPNIMLPSVDIRDVAMAHWLAVVKPGISGERFIIDKESWTMLRILKVLKAEFKQHGYKVKDRQVGYCPLKIASWFDSQIKIVLNMVNQEIYADNTKSIRELGLEYKHDIATSVIEMGYSMIEMGVIPDKRKKK